MSMPICPVEHVVCVCYDKNNRWSTIYVPMYMLCVHHLHVHTYIVHTFTMAMCICGGVYRYSLVPRPTFGSKIGPSTHYLCMGWR